MTSTRLIIITVPPRDMAQKLQQLRKPLCDRYDAPWALAYPPHVTLRTGVIVPDDELPEILQAFESLLAQTSPFTLRTGRACYGNMHYEGQTHFFLYLPVHCSDPLQALHERLLSYTKYRKSNKRHFNPHVTLLWGDIPPDEEAVLCTSVDQGHAQFRQTFSWVCEGVSFYVEREDTWELFHHIPFGESNTVTSASQSPRSLTKS